VLNTSTGGTVRRGSVMRETLALREDEETLKE
jgi:hypothetical protein